MHIFFSVGEPSGDQHAAHLIGELRKRRPDVEISGYGGPLMERAGCRVLFRLTDLAVMFIWSVVPLLWRFFTLVRRAGRFFREERPDAVVLVDFPGFNWWIARQAKRAGIPVFYYLPPQLWAWGPWRVRKMRRFVDHILCGLPFEPKWYAERGLEACHVGHPFFDEVAEHPLDREFCEQWRTVAGDARIVGVLPGSRNKEVSRNWPLMVEVIRKLNAKHPRALFLVACYRPEHRDRCQALLRAAGCGGLPVHFFVDRTPEIIETADCCLMVSGSVSLEMLARATPAVVLYRITRFTNLMKRLFLTIDSITLPNLMAGRPVFPEWVVWRSPRRAAKDVTATLDGWLSDSASLSAAARELAAVRDELVRTGATPRTAEAILSRIDVPPTEAVRRAA